MSILPFSLLSVMETSDSWDTGPPFSWSEFSARWSTRRLFSGTVSWDSLQVKGCRNGGLWAIHFQLYASGKKWSSALFHLPRCAIVGALRNIFCLPIAQSERGTYSSSQRCERELVSIWNLRWRTVWTLKILSAHSSIGRARSLYLRGSRFKS